MISNIIHFINTKIFKRIILHYELKYFRKTLGYCDNTSFISLPKTCSCAKKIFLYENTNIFSGAKFIINPISKDGNFIMKKNSGSAENLTIITGNHQRIKGHLFKEFSSEHTIDIDKDIIVEEDVWLGANVTLLSGVVVGRGATVGAGSVCTKSIPPYSIVMGNPAKVIGFNFTPKEVIEHEKALYEDSERLPIDLLEKNYQKYFLNRASEIKTFIK